MSQLSVFAIIILACIIFFYISGKKKSRWGINFKRVYCPVCHTKQPLIRMPNSDSQAMWGGTTCPNCRTELDKYGDVISKT